ncbi:MAG TPA: hypothetical protein VGI58_04885 [Streptosporangiaceae bacterium]|jgi:hypothetical protein
MKLSTRFLAGNAFVTGGAFLAVAAMTFGAHLAGWVGFGVFTGLAITAFASAAISHTASVKVSYSLLGLVGLWSLIATLLFTGSALTWLVFAGGIALAVVALADLAVHEATTEKVVHQLVISDRPATSEPGVDRIAA